ncbi:MAG: hypothetical protein JXR58_02520 [Bacteroidales bacterium]|nr:hypothetical protein [Bacteroidales bacterium]
MSKQFFYSLVVLVIISFTTIYCKKKDVVEPIPPTLNIISEDTTGTLGKLTVYAYYAYNHTLVSAPSQTDVQLFASSEDLDRGIAMFKTWTYGTNNSINFGYLNPGTYYILAFNKINSYDYEGVIAVQVNQGLDRVHDVVMEKVIYE